MQQRPKGNMWIYNPLQGCGGNNNSTTDCAGDCRDSDNMVAQ